MVGGLLVAGVVLRVVVVCLPSRMDTLLFSNGDAKFLPEARDFRRACNDAIAALGRALGAVVCVSGLAFTSLHADGQVDD